MENYLLTPRFLAHINDVFSASTMIIDEGLSCLEVRHLTQMSEEGLARFTHAKIAYGSAALYAPTILKEKLRLYREAGIRTFTGGTLFEFMFHQTIPELAAFFGWARMMGFAGIELSNGTLEIREEALASMSEVASKDFDLSIMLEVGSKAHETEWKTAEWARRISHALTLDPEFVILEGRASGNAGIYNAVGLLREPVRAIITKIDCSRIMFEAPRRGQQCEMLSIIGPSVNLGNIRPADVLPLACLRAGLRSETLKAHETEKEDHPKGTAKITHPSDVQS